MTRRPTVIKVCGLTSAEDALAAVAAGADAVGVVLSEGGPRCLTLEQAAEVLAPVPSRVARVGVFVDASREEVDRAVATLGLKIAQLHGSESPAFCAETSALVVKAFRVDAEFSPAAVEPYLGVVFGVLLDSGAPGQAGGTGRTFDWERAAGLDAPALLVAGGLTPENVAEAVKLLRPFGVDVSSGVESAPGVKDHDKIRAFVRAVREADEEMSKMTEILLPSASQAYSGPDAEGFFGPYGGSFVPETVVPALHELTAAFEAAKADPAFAEEFDSLMRDYVGRPSPLYRAERLAAAVGLGDVYLKREDLNHTGAHKINNCVGQCLLARRMGKKRVIAETGAGQHGVATATAAALFGMECAVFMGTEDIRRQSLNVYRMRLLGAEVVPVAEGTGTLADAVTAALRHWVERVEDTFYVLGSAVGPHPYPAIVREYQSVIGRETLTQLADKGLPLPDAVVACVGGGSNAIGMFAPFIASVPRDRLPLLVGAEAAGLGLDTDKHGASLTLGSPGVLHGFYSYLLQDDAGNPREAYSISAGLDYPGVGPEHSHLKDEGLVRYEAVTDQEAVDAFALLCRCEGIIPAIESSHALALLPRLAAELGPDATVVVNLSGRGDKDVDIVREAGLGG